MSGLHFDGLFVSYKELAPVNVSESSPFKQALKFCKAYIGQQQEFPVQTSGSSGPPKLITINHNQLKISALMTIEALGLKADYKGLVCISVDHIGGKMMLVRGMELGMDMYLVEPSSAIDLQDLPPIDFVALVPLQLQALMASPPGRKFLDACQAAIVGGGQISETVAASLDQIKCPIYQTFGMTETVSHFALKPLNGVNKDQSYHAFEQVSLSLDERGCLIVVGELTNNLPVVTNDLVELTGERTFTWLGRYDRAINTGGYKVIPEQLGPQVSACLNSCGVQGDFVIIGLPNPKWGQQVTLVLEHDPLGFELEKRLIVQLKKVLHPYQVPKVIECLNKFPRTDTRKVEISEITKLLR